MTETQEEDPRRPDPMEAMTLTDAAAIMGTSRQFVYKLIKEGKLWGIKELRSRFAKGGATYEWKVRRGDLDRYIAARWWDRTDPPPGYVSSLPEREIAQICEYQRAVMHNKRSRPRTR